MTQREWRLRSRGAFRSHVGNRPCGAQVIADEVDCSPKTAQSWLAGETTPSGILDLRAMNAIPAYAALKREIAALEDGIDPRIQAKLYELYRMTMQLANGGDATKAMALIKTGEIAAALGNVDGVEIVSATDDSAPVAAAAAPTRRTRGPNKPRLATVTVPAAEPPQVSPAQLDIEHPDFLKRTA